MNRAGTEFSVFGHWGTEAFRVTARGHLSGRLRRAGLGLAAPYARLGQRGVGIAAWVAFGVALAAVVVMPAVQPAYLWSWLIIGVIFLSFKCVELATAPPGALRQMGPLRVIGFVLLWPGMKLSPFVDAAAERVTPQGAAPPAEQGVGRLVAGGLLNAALGLAAIAATSLPLVQRWPLMEAALGLLGGGLIVLYGAFDLLTALWRWRGVAVERQWRFLPASKSLADYWATRWNRAFHDFVEQHVYTPLKGRFGVGTALLGSFLFSGVLHDVFISVPARGGYGLPTLYFMLQGLGIWCERRLIPRGPLRRVWGALVLLLPVGLLFHQPFIEKVVLPQLAALRGGAG